MVVALTWEDGVYLFALSIEPEDSESKYNATGKQVTEKYLSVFLHLKEMQILL